MDVALIMAYRVLEKILLHQLMAPGVGAGVDANTQVPYENAPQDALYISSVLDMRKPGGRSGKKQDGLNQEIGMYSKDSAFARVLKLQEALYKVQGRIAKVADSLRMMEEFGVKIKLEDVTEGL